MQLFSYSKSDRPTSVYRNSGLVVVILFLLITLAGCGGNPSSSMAASQPQTPVVTPAQPADPPSSGSGSSGSGSSSGSPSSGSPSNSSPSSGSPSNNPPAPPGVPAGAQTFSAVQTLPNWLWCTQKLNGKVCAAGLGDATSSMTPNQATPSMSGASAVLTLGGKTQYSNALWWHSFGAHSTPTTFCL